MNKQGIGYTSPLNVLEIIIMNLFRFFKENKYVYGLLGGLLLFWIFGMGCGIDAAIALRSMNQPSYIYIFYNEYYNELIPMLLNFAVPAIASCFYLYAAFLSPMIRRWILSTTTTLPEKKDGRAYSEEEKETYYVARYVKYRAKNVDNFSIHLFYLILIVATLHSAHAMEHNHRVYEKVLAFQEDEKILTSGDIPVSLGAMYETKEPLNIEGYAKINPDPSMIYFRFMGADRWTQDLRCKRELYDEDILTDALIYKVQYLPYSKTLISIEPVSLEESQKAAEKVYGYDALTDKEKRLFIRMYSEQLRDIYMEEYDQENPYDYQGVVNAYLDDTYDEEEFDRVLSFYKTVHYEDTIPIYEYGQYGGHSDDLLISSPHYAPFILEDYMTPYEQAAKKAVDEMPKDLDDAGKCNYISQYLCNRTTPSNVETLAQKYGGDPQASAEIVGKRQNPFGQTGYSALVEGYAGSAGYAKAFAKIGKLAGLNVICVSAKNSNGTEFYGNMVNINDSWYHINVYLQEKIPEMEAAFFLQNEETMAAPLQALGVEVNGYGYGDLDYSAPVSAKESYPCEPRASYDAGIGIQVDCSSEEYDKLREESRKLPYSGMVTDKGTTSTLGIPVDWTGDEAADIDRLTREIFMNYIFEGYFANAEYWYYDEDNGESEGTDYVLDYTRGEAMDPCAREFFYWLALNYTRPTAFSKDIPNTVYQSSLEKAPAYVWGFDSLQSAIFEKDFEETYQLMSGAELLGDPKEAYCSYQYRQYWRYDPFMGVHFLYGSGTKEDNLEIAATEVRKTEDGFSELVTWNEDRDFEERFVQIEWNQLEDGSLQIQSIHKVESED